MKPVENRDLDLAKTKLMEDDLCLVIVKNGKVIFETKKRGIGGFIEAIDEVHQNLVAASVADKVIGVAAAMLCAYSGVSSVFALTISEGGAKTLEANNIAYAFEEKVSNILNRDKTDVCPFEKLAMSSESPDDAYVKLLSLARKLVTKPEKADCV